MKLCAQLLMYLVLVSNIANADEPDACRTLAYDYTSHTPNELRQIADQCSSPNMQHLYLNRAYHIRLTERFQDYSQLKTWPGLIGKNRHSNTYAYTSYTAFIDMIEAFASQASETTFDSTVDELNIAYDKAMEIAELRLKGNDVRADWIQHNDGFSQNTQSIKNTIP